MSAPGNNRQTVFDAIAAARVPVTMQEIAERCRHLHPRSLVQAVYSLRRDGIIRKDRRGKTATYQLAPGAARPDDRRGKKEGG